MKILLVSATIKEIEPFLKENYLDFPFSKNTSIPIYYQNNKTIFSYKNNSVDILIHGIGAPMTSFSLGQYLSKENYDYIIQAGIAGSFSYDLELGTLVEINSECFGDIGAEDKEGNFIDFYADLKLINDNTSTDLPKTKGITINTVSGTESTISKRKHLGDIETMEGAAFFYCCSKLNIPKYSQIRAISNYLEPRNKENWKMDLAITNLNDFLQEFLENLK
jgi:futalosine hydrolase